MAAKHTSLGCVDVKPLDGAAQDWAQRVKKILTAAWATVFHLLSAALTRGNMLRLDRREVNLAAWNQQRPHAAKVIH